MTRESSKNFRFFFFVNEIFSNIYLKFPCLEAFFWNKTLFLFWFFSFCNSPDSFALFSLRASFFSNTSQETFLCRKKTEIYLKFYIHFWFGNHFYLNICINKLSYKQYFLYFILLPIDILFYKSIIKISKTRAATHWFHLQDGKIFFFKFIQG